jgi:hypothetical protein
LTDDETPKVAALLGEASQIILEVYGIPERIAAGLLTDGTLRSVTTRMVLRVLLNPQRLSQFAVSVEDVSRSGTYESGSTPAGELALTPAELERLWGIVGLPGAFSVLQPPLLVPPVDENGFPAMADYNKLWLLDPTD